MGLEIVHLPLLDSSNATQMALLRGAELALVFVGTTAGEGHDRPNLTLCALSCGLPSCPAVHPPATPGGCWQDEMVVQVAAAARRTAVVVSTPGAVLLPWGDSVDAILVAWLPGQEFGSAVAGAFSLAFACFLNVRSHQPPWSRLMLHERVRCSPVLPVADILFGTTSPSGKLPLTLPASENQLNMTQLQYPGHIPNTTDPRRRKPAYANYTERLEVISLR